MKNLFNPLIDKHRLKTKMVINHFGSFGDSKSGMFIVPSPIDGAEIKVVASNGPDWQHVSVSRVNRCPNWTEMDFIKDLFFFDHETVMQLHVAKNEHINVHNYCLHLWKPVNDTIPMPPREYV